MSRYSARKAILCKLEATYGTDPNPTGSADFMLVHDFQFPDPMAGSDVELAHALPYLSANPTTPADLHRRCTFKVPLTGSGTPGTAPAWAPLLRACGVAETLETGPDQVVYNPVSGGFESATLYAHMDGTLYKMLGMRGNARFVVPASGIPVIEFEFWGLFSKPSDTALPTIDASAYQKARAATPANTPTFTLGGTSVPLRNFNLDFGNSVEVRKLINEDQVKITDRADMIETQIAAGDLATYDPFTDADTAAERAIVLTHGTTPGNIATISVPKAQTMRPGVTEAQGQDEWTVGFRPLPGSGNDQWTLTLT